VSGTSDESSHDKESSGRNLANIERNSAAASP